MNTAERLRALHAEWADCTRCSLCRDRVRIVPGYGNPESRIMCISDKPGMVEEDTCTEDGWGIPMTGPAGKFYTDVLKQLGKTLEDVYTTNSVMCRSPDNRDPFDYELLECKERLFQEILLIDPYFIVTMGKVTMQSLLGVNKAISKCQLKTYLLPIPGVQDVYYPCVITYNPAWVRKHPSLGRGEPWHFLFRAIQIALDGVTELERDYGRRSAP